jgi:hypothetical protein
MTRTVFTGGSVFDGTSAPPSPGDVVIEDGLVVEVGVGLDGDVEVDCSGATVLPGLIDCHVHVMVTDVDSLRMAYTPFSYSFFQAAQNLRRTLEAGITTVRDAGGADLGVKKAVEDGLIDGPRMQISVGPLSITGGHGDDWLPSGTHLEFFVPHPGRPSGLCDGPDEVRRTVRQMLRAGADVIKVHTTGGVLSPTDDPRHAHFSPAELDVMVAEAAAQGATVMAHAQGAEGIKNAVRAGIRSVEHGIYLDDEAIELMLRHGTWLVPTLSAPLAVIRAAEAGASIPESSVRQGTRRRRGPPGVVRPGRGGRRRGRDGDRRGGLAARDQPRRAAAHGRRRDDAGAGAGGDHVGGGGAAGAAGPGGAVGAGDAGRRGRRRGRRPGAGRAAGAGTPGVEGRGAGGGLTPVDPAAVRRGRVRLGRAPSRAGGLASSCIPRVAGAPGGVATIASSSCLASTDPSARP